MFLSVTEQKSNRSNFVRGKKDLSKCVRSYLALERKYESAIKMKEAEGKEEQNYVIIIIICNYF